MTSSHATFLSASLSLGVPRHLERQWGNQLRALWLVGLYMVACVGHLNTRHIEPVRSFQIMNNSTISNDTMTLQTARQSFLVFSSIWRPFPFHLVVPHLVGSISSSNPSHTTPCQHHTLAACVSRSAWRAYCVKDEISERSFCAFAVRWLNRNCF